MLIAKFSSQSCYFIVHAKDIKRYIRKKFVASNLALLECNCTLSKVLTPKRIFIVIYCIKQYGFSTDWFFPCLVNFG